ncbi:pilus assembly protein TadG-related protein [Cumulibacter manganitolerans]|uniref:pilus assembly protein TadG-related protein n=1 Tax=Cumulibacter manganitolerans TaxID=1884992 RepID=UPI0012959156|nr:pilus assembly protein TadG-related protein [Cumulibacter manganitolerans]
MHRLTNDRGAVAVLVALLMVPLIGFAAVAIDVAAMWSEKQKLQTGADAAALAIAQDCARSACGQPGQTAQNLATANFPGGQALGAVTDPALTATSGKVTVRTSTVSKHLFAPVLGIGSSPVAAQATAGWGSPNGGTAVLPLAFSWCEFKAQTGGGLPSSTTTQTIYFTKTSGTTGCTGPSNNLVPGGFGWLSVNAGTCKTTSAINSTMWTSTGASVPTGCSVGDFSALQNRTALLPIFDQSGENGTNAWYRVYGYAAFQITGYYFGGQYVWNEGPCKGEARCIRGYFTQFVDLSNVFTYSTDAPKMGAGIVSLKG